MCITNEPNFIETRLLVSEIQVTEQRTACILKLAGLLGTVFCCFTWAIAAYKQARFIKIENSFVDLAWNGFLVPMYRMLQVVHFTSLFPFRFAVMFLPHFLYGIKMNFIYKFRTFCECYIELFYP